MDTSALTVSCRVLMVEDDPALSDMYRLGLRARGIEVHVAPTGREGLTSAEALRPDIVVLDIQLPDITGVDVLRGIRGSAGFNSLPVFILSNLDGEIEDECRALGVTDYLVKSQTTPGQLADRLLRSQARPN